MQEEAQFCSNVNGNPNAVNSIVQTDLVLCSSTVKRKDDTYLYCGKEKPREAFVVLEQGRKVCKECFQSKQRTDQVIFERCIFPCMQRLSTPGQSMQDHLVLKTCIRCHKEKDVRVNFKARHFQLEHQQLFARHVEAVCIDCTDASVVSKLQRHPNLLIDKIMLAIPDEVLENTPMSTIEKQLRLQCGRCVGCNEAITHIGITSDPRRFLSMAQRFTARIIIKPARNIGVKIMSDGRFVYCHEECRVQLLQSKYNVNNVNVNSVNKDDKYTTTQSFYPILISELTADTVTDIHYLAEQKREIVEQIVSTLSVKDPIWHNRIAQLRNEAQVLALKKHLGQLLQNVWRSLEPQPRTSSNSQQQQHQRRKRLVPVWRDQQVRVISHFGDEPVISNHAQWNVYWDSFQIQQLAQGSSMWKRHANGCYARARARGAIAQETVTPDAIFSMYWQQHCECSMCHTFLEPDDISVNRIDTSRMDLPYGGNFDLAHADCNIADSDNNVQQMIQGWKVKFETFLNLTPEEQTAKLHTQIMNETEAQVSTLQEEWSKQQRMLLNQFARLRAWNRDFDGLHRTWLTQNGAGLPIPLDIKQRMETNDSSNNNNNNKQMPTYKDAWDDDSDDDNIVTFEDSLMVDESMDVDG